MAIISGYIKRDTLMRVGTICIKKFYLLQINYDSKTNYQDGHLLFNNYWFYFIKSVRLNVYSLILLNYADFKYLLLIKIITGVEYGYFFSRY